MYHALYNELVCRTIFTCTNCILQTSSVPQHDSAHHKCHHQTVFIALVKMLSNGPLYHPTDHWQHYDNKYTDSLMMARVMCRNMLDNRWCVNDTFSAC